MDLIKRRKKHTSSEEYYSFFFLLHSIENITPADQKENIFGCSLM